MSESSVKRLFARQSFSLQRLEQILNLSGSRSRISSTLMNERREFLTELTPEQEDALLADPKQLLMTYLLVNGWPLAAITSTFAIDDAEAERLLIRLHRARIIELLPFNRVKLLTARNFTWRKNGPVQRVLRARGAARIPRLVVRGPRRALALRRAACCRATSLAQLQQSIDRLAREFDELARRDAALPLASGAAAAPCSRCGPWEFSMFAALRRKKVSGPAPR